MINSSKYIASIVLVFALFAINGSELLHHHEGDEFHSDDKCQACFFSKTLSSTESPVSNPGISLTESYQDYRNTETVLSQAEASQCSYGRAPPLFSHPNSI